MQTRLAINGAAGRMGQRIVALACETGDFEIVAALERPDHPQLGRDAGELAGVGLLGVVLSAKPGVAADVMIDFSLPEGAMRALDVCTGTKTALVTGTTGLNDEHARRLEQAAKVIAIVHETNMSVGMNVLFTLVGQVAQLLGEQYDIEITEAHHRFKKDAPSGSARTLARRICQAMNWDFPGAMVHGRSGPDALRQPGTIGMHALRAGDITGFHSVIYSTLGETVTLSHTAHSRDTFVHGALRAARWVKGRPAGLYGMAEVLGLPS
jgi:4-hydroxy-tetrahydrodipicolinate reductase